MFVVPPVSNQASPTTLLLAQKIAVVIQEFEQTHPGTSKTEVSHALQIAGMGLGSNQRLIRIALLVGLLLLGLGFALFFSRAS